ncbi:hypothetical protein NSPZN2_30193 [Nitrospira defluvii]|uniref:Uncharacterized protein n=1 Tax=Nitrospira defluvii TaxID=330214 RepID=A0ABM8RG69_9BACT|nr:hypothetical protein NSPZN2_30193 [Nitrospira defluvii]
MSAGESFKTGGRYDQQDFRESTREGPGEVHVLLQDGRIFFQPTVHRCDRGLYGHQ